MMDFIIENIGTLLICFTVLLITWSMRRPSGMPPGPLRLPFIGNILSMDVDIKKTFKKMRERYGDIFSVYIFNEPIIVMNGYAVINDALVKNADVFSDRPISFLGDQLSNKKGIVFTSGDIWREHRRFSLSTMRDFGMGKSVLEQNICGEITNLMSELKSKDGHSFNCKYMIQCAVANVICAMAFGKSYQYTDKVFQKIVENLDFIVHIGSASVVNIFPSVRYLPGDFFDFWKLTAAKEVIENECIRPVVEEHLKNYNDNDVSDFTYAYIKEMKNKEQQGKPTTMDVEGLRMTVLQLFMAGTETTATTLRWVLLYFLHNPEVQEKCFQEIERVIGLERLPSMKDKVNLPYIEATIAEIQRCADIVPASVAHSVPHTLQYKGFTFEKGVTIMPMLSSVLEDPEIWGDPQNFRPERFLDTDGKFSKKESQIPFSIGKRACLGESLARMELFLFLTSMIQRFKFCQDGDVITPLTYVAGTVYSPPEFDIVAVPRKQ